MSVRTGFAVPAQIVTPDTEDKFPVAETNDIKGAQHYVDNKEDLEKISTQHLLPGMSAYVKNEQTYYDLQNNNQWKKRETYQKDLTPWKDKNVLHANSYGATVMIPVQFLTPAGQEYSILDSAGTSGNVIIDETMKQYASLSEITTKPVKYSEKGYKLVTKAVADEVTSSKDYATNEERFAALAGNKLIAEGKAYTIQTEDIVKNSMIYEKTVSGGQQLKGSVVNVAAYDVVMGNNAVKNANGTYHLSDMLPNVFLDLNQNDDSNVTQGKGIQSIDNYGIAVGMEAAVIGSGAAVIGYKAYAQGANAFAAGREAQVKGESAVAVGASSSAINNSAVALGNEASSAGPGAAAIGSKAKAAGSQSIAVGNAVADAELSIAVGNQSHAAAIKGVAVGENSYAEEGSIAVGSKSQAKAKHAAALGENTTAAGDNSVAIGVNSRTDASEANVISVGSISVGSITEFKRRIVHVAEGVNATDAVNKSQLDNLANKVSVIPEDAKFTDTTYETALPETNEDSGRDGLMSASDKAKLDSLSYVDTTQFVKNPDNGDSYLVQSNADKLYAPIASQDNPYIHKKELDAELAEYATTKAVSDSVQQAMGITQENPDGIYQKKEEAITESQIKEWIQNAVQEALFTANSSGTKTPVYVRQDDIAGLIKDALEQQKSAETPSTAGTSAAIQNREGTTGTD